MCPSWLLILLDIIMPGAVSGVPLHGSQLSRGCVRRKPCKLLRGWMAALLFSAMLWRQSGKARSKHGKKQGGTHRVPGKKRPLVDHLCKDAADGPDVHRRGVVLCSKQDLRSSVPQCHHLQQRIFLSGFGKITQSHTHREGSKVSYYWARMSVQEVTTYQATLQAWCETPLVNKKDFRGPLEQACTLAIT